jgi:NAD(P)H-flavin reductase
MTEQTLAVQAATPVLPDAQTVTSVRHYTDKLFAFRVTRPRTLRFRSGEFVMIGLWATTASRCCAPTPSPRLPGTTSWSSTRSRCRTGR